MSDWADYFHGRVYKKMTAVLGMEDQHIITEALRAARNEALEEAAQIAEEEMVCYWIDDLDLTKNNACERVASNIRALKDKQP